MTKEQEEILMKANDFFERNRKEIRKMFRENHERKIVQEIIAKQAQARIEDIEREEKLIDEFDTKMEVARGFIKDLAELEED